MVPSSLASYAKSCHDPREPRLKQLLWEESPASFQASSEPPREKSTRTALGASRQTKRYRWATTSPSRSPRKKEWHRARDAHRVTCSSDKAYEKAVSERVQGATREQGIVVSISESWNPSASSLSTAYPHGMIRCADRDAQFIFYLKDVDMSILKASAQKGSGKKASAAAVAASATKPFVGMEVDFAAVANPRDLLALCTPRASSASRREP